METKPSIVVERFPSEKDWTLSEFYIDGIRRGVGVEDEYREVKVKGETRIPNGVYELDLRISPHFSKEYFADDHGYLSKYKDARFKTEHLMIWVKDVPGFEFILLHWGNLDDSTDGCYCVGCNFATFGTQKGVSGSRAKYLEVYPVIYQMIVKNKKEGIKTFIEYKDKAKVLA
jgi:hypothetical protein